MSKRKQKFALKRADGSQESFDTDKGGVLRFKPDGTWDLFHLSDTQITRLGDLICEDTEFMRESEELISYVRVFKDMRPEKARRVKEDLERIRKAFLKASPEARMAFDAGWVMANIARLDTKANITPCLQAVAAANGDFPACDSSTLRFEVGKRAREILERFDVHTGTSDTGEYTNYLQFIREVSGLEFDPHKLSRDILGGDQ
jgi:hypothetical protein